MSGSAIIGHERARVLLARLLASGRTPHALLFHGPEGVGKSTIARGFAAALLCEAPVEGAACGRCTSCGKASRGNHPDLLLVTRLPRRKTSGGDGDEDDGDEPAAGGGELRSFILVRQIREVVEHAAYAPREGPRRVFLIDPADRMNAEAQNALLKTLEEPPGEAILLLVASRPHALLPTVRSRCFPVGFAALAPADLARALEQRGLARDEAVSRAALASGRPGAALALDLPALRERRDAILGALVALASSPASVADLPAAAADLCGEGGADLVASLDVVQALLRDAARDASGRKTVLHTDARDGVRALGRALGASRAAEIVGLVDRLRDDLRLNLNRSLVAETVLAAVAGAPAPQRL